MKNFKVGAAKLNITPPIDQEKGAWEVDFVPTLDEPTGRRELGKPIYYEGVHDDLYAKALVLDNGEQRLAMIVADLGGPTTEFTLNIRDLVEKRTGIPKGNVLVACTHTHTGPTAYAKRTFGDWPYDESLGNIYARKLASSVYMANNDLREARFGRGRGCVEGVAANRRNPERPTDPEVGVLRFDGADGSLRSALVNFSCHPTVVRVTRYISKDFPHYALRVIEKVKGEDIVAIFTNGTEGNQSTRYTRREETFREADRLGTMLGAEALKTLERVETTDQVSIGTASEIIDFPLRDKPSVEEARRLWEKRVKEFEKYKGQKVLSGEARTAMINILGAEHALRLAQSDIKEVKAEMQAIAINDTILIGIPGEMFVEFGLEIKKNSPFKFTYLIGLANETVGYIPTPEAFEEGGYEVGSAIIAPESGKLIVKTALRLADKLK